MRKVIITIRRFSVGSDSETTNANHNYNMNDKFWYKILVCSVAVDTSHAGNGTVSAEVQSQRTRPAPKVIAQQNGRHVVEFRTMEGGEHRVKVLFNNQDVPGEV